MIESVTFLRSPAGAFVRSPAGARMKSGTTSTPALIGRGCYALRDRQGWPAIGLFGRGAYAISDNPFLLVQDVTLNYLYGYPPGYAYPGYTFTWNSGVPTTYNQSGISGGNVTVRYEGSGGGSAWTNSFGLIIDDGAGGYSLSGPISPPAAATLTGVDGVDLSLLGDNGAVVLAWSEAPPYNVMVSEPGRWGFNSNSAQVTYPTLIPVYITGPEQYGIEYDGAFSGYYTQTIDETFGGWPWSGSSEKLIGTAGWIGADGMIGFAWLTATMVAITDPSMIAATAGWFIWTGQLGASHFQVRCTAKPVFYWWGKFKINNDLTSDNVMHVVKPPAILYPSTGWAGPAACYTTSPTPDTPPSDATVPQVASLVVMIVNCTPSEFLTRNPGWSLA